MDLEKLKDELLRDESLRTRPYRDTVGKLTIGVGRNLDDVGISVEEARFLLENDIARTMADLSAEIPWWATLDETRKRVLVNMAFNMGVRGLLGFKNALELMRCGQYLDAANHMLDSKWARQVGPRAVRLAQMMRDGDSGALVA
jgi:lysozyme